MNNDLISREALKKALDEQMYFDENCRDSVFEIIDNAPTVDIKDQIAGAYNEGYMCGNKEAEKARPQGEWLHHEEYTNDRPFYITECPFCKLRVQEETNFCPNCGNDMRGDNNG